MLSLLRPAALAAALALPLFSQDAPFEYPDTPAARRTKAVLEALNAADEASYRALDELRSQASRDQVPFEQLLPALRAVRSQTGEMTPHSVIESEEARLVLLVKLSAGDAWGRLEVGCEAEDPHLVESFFVVPSAPPEGVAVEYEGWRSLADLLELARGEGEFPALAAAVASSEGPIGEAAVGRGAAGEDGESTEGGRSVGTGDRFHAGSITKAITATMIGRLVERGELTWGATLGETLEGVEMSPAYAAVELRQLLRHRAGLPSHTNFDEAGLARLHALTGSPTEQRETWILEVLREEPTAEPGTTMSYSNSGYTVSALVAERAAGKSWESLLDEHVFAPLGIEGAGYGWPPAEETRGHYGTGVPADPGYALAPCMAPAGDVHLTAGDLARFGRMHLRGLNGTDGPLRAETVRELHRVPEGTGVQSYAAGWVVTTSDDGQEVHWHNGSAGTYYALLAIYPGQDLVVAVMTNMASPVSEPIAWKVVEAIRARERGEDGEEER